MPRILAIGQVEDRRNIDKQILKQSLPPDRVILYEDKNPAEKMAGRRQRIAENHQKLIDIVKAYPDYDLIWQVEGDCIYTPDTLQLLVRSYEQLDSPLFGYVSGVQVGRHGIYALGAWHFSDNREEFQSVDHTVKGAIEVDATGFYCLLAKRDAWLKGVCSWNGEHWGPDVNWGLSLRQQGYKLYADTNIPVGHRLIRRTIGGQLIDHEIWPDQASTCNVRFKRGDNGWEYNTS